MDALGKSLLLSLLIIENFHPHNVAIRYQHLYVANIGRGDEGG